VAVPPLEDWVRGRSAYYDPAYVSVDRRFAHAHITLLGPFLDRISLTAVALDRVGSVLARHEPFPLALDRVAAFAGGTIYLRPEPAENVSRLTADLVEAFPGLRPYGGRFADVVPHLTLDHIGPGVDVDSVRQSLADLLPVRAEVREVSLSWYEQDACRELARWRLGSG
jgi:2'-5' RNA ligase